MTKNSGHYEADTKDTEAKRRPLQKRQKPLQKTTNNKVQTTKKLQLTSYKRYSRKILGHKKEKEQ